MQQNDILEIIKNKDKRLIAKLITKIENRGQEAIDIIKKIYKYTGKAWVIGVTGTAGVGKSTLVDGMISYFRKENKTLGVIAVDPTSPFSGGALLADRIRMQMHSLDDEVFIRSMATRGHLGGLSAAASDVIDFLDACGKDIIIVETVGVGQDEIDVVKIAQSIIVVLMPGMGDEIQAMKAGLMEIADIFVINKADKEGTEKLEIELERLIEMSSNLNNWKPNIIKTIATNKIGIDELCSSLKKHYEYIKSSNKYNQRLFQAAQQRLIDAYCDLSIAKAINKLKEEEYKKIIQNVYERKIDPYTAVEEFLKI